ncbi:anti-repressor SinI family protein [Alicyclobacillus acidiphilus]|uniref:anti-repressor SinI family protein n=1 Tax=Alicyclobacillus acidiphilus TaxID=182455 RepID=UPI0012EEBB53|nr:anti-repressor SinI family protein [Alicyclobacillus acidiphilus]
MTVLLNKPVDDEWIRLIVAAKQMGLTIAEVRNYVIECLKSANAGEGRQSEIES